MKNKLNKYTNLDEHKTQPTQNITTSLEAIQHLKHEYYIKISSSTLT